MFIENGDWLQEEYEKIQKNQTLSILQLRLDKINRQNEQIIEMKKRVAKQKLNVTSNNSHHLNNTRKKKELVEDKENVQDESNLEYEEDNDLILEECERKDDEESDGEEIPDKEESKTKVLPYI